MPSQLPPEMLTTFRSLAQVVYSSESYDSVYDDICMAAVALVDGCDHASLMLRDRHGRLGTVGSSDEMAQAVDALERKHDEGPCIDAIDESAPDEHLCPDLAQSGRWPRLTEHLLAETTVRGVAGFRIRQEGERIGALNAFSDTPGALDEHSMHQMSLIAAFASVTLAALERGEEATTLRRGLESNREIGKAVGLLMALHSIDDARAFEMLAKVSQEMNIKVAEVAAQVVRHHSKPS